MKKFLRTFLSFSLSAAMILTAVPAMAENNPQAENYEISNTAETSEISNMAEYNSESEEPYIIGELTNKREENTKYYRMSDHTYIAAVYDEAVHYFENGEWKDIDNSFKKTTDTDDKTEVLETKKNSFDTKFARKSKGKKLVTVKKDDYKIDWSLEGAKKVTAKVVDSESNETDDENETNRSLELKNRNGIVQYKNILKNVDLSYTVTANSIKEDIVLKNKNVPGKFVFN